jgi:beta-1,4-mannosyltransferase
MECDREPIRVAFYPPARRAEPSNFVSMLARAVEGAGARVVPTGPLRLRWCLTQSQVDVVHLHWLEYVAAADPRPVTGWLLTWGRLGRLVAQAAALRARGTTLVWTIHNLSPHEPVRPRSQKLLTRAVYRLADQVVVHSEFARARVIETFGERRGRAPRVIPHGNYVDVFPTEPRNREEVRASLGIPPGAFVYLAFGVIRRYKRLGLLAERFRSLTGDDLRLLVAGTPSERDELNALERQAAADPRIIVHPAFVPDEAVRGLHLAADVAVIAYVDVFSSGALLLALSCGLPVVAPAVGTARELFTPPAVEFFDGDDLIPALERVRTGKRAAAARRAVERFDWAGVGSATVGVYRRALSTS